MLKGSFVALVTPFLENGDINYPKLKQLLEYHIENDTDGIVILGTTAEATTLSFDEQISIIKFSVEIVNKRVPIIVGAGSNDTNIAIKKAKEFSNFDIDYLLVITPYYNKTNTKGLLNHFTNIADVSKVPIIMYNVPSRTGMSIPLSIMEKLSSHPNICGIKEASGNMSYAVGLIKYLSDDFVMLSGNDDLIVPMMSIGSKGVISVLANVCPKQTHDMCMLCLNEEYAKAAIIQSDLLDVINALFYETNPIPVKAAMNHLGFNVGKYRLPLYDMDDILYDKMIAILNDKKEIIK